MKWTIICALALIEFIAGNEGVGFPHAPAHSMRPVVPEYRTVRRETPAGVIGLSHESSTAASLGQPLEVRITITSPHRVDSLTADVYAHEGLTVSAPSFVAPQVEGGESVHWVLKFTPYVEGALRFSVLVQGKIDGENQAAQLTVPVQVGNVISTREKI